MDKLYIYKLKKYKKYIYIYIYIIKRVRQDKIVIFLK